MLSPVYVVKVKKIADKRFGFLELKSIFFSVFAEMFRKRVV